MAEDAACPVAPLARGLNRIMARHAALEAEAERLAGDAAAPLHREMAALIERAYALEDEATFRRTLSAGGAIFQLGILASMAADPRDARFYEQAVRRLAHSLMGHLERASGLRREDVAPHAGLDRDGDPLALVEAALAEDPPSAG